MDHSDDLSFAFDMARRSAEIALEYFDGPVDHELKPDGSPVSEVDLAIEAELIDTLGRERPSDAILSEERGAIGVGSRRWILDPLDGTSLFLERTTRWGTLITLHQDDVAVVAVVSRPAESRCWWAVRGQGAFEEDLSKGLEGERRLRVSDTDTLTSATVTVGWGADVSPERSVCVELPGWTEPGNTFPRLVHGQLDVMVAISGAIWDHAPAVLIVEEAGGVFRDRRGGHRLDLEGGVYTNAHLADPVGALLQWY